MHAHTTGLEKPRFFKKKFLGFKIFKVFLKVLMYEDRSQNYNLEIHEEYLISHA